MEFTPKRRLLAAIRGEEVDRVPFAPFLAYYFDFLPQEVRNRGMLEYYEQIGADPLLRGFGDACGKEPVDCTVTQTIDGEHKYVSYEQPQGTLRFGYTYVQKADTWFLTEHPVQTVEDVRLLTRYFRNLRIVPRVAELNERVRGYGERALNLSTVGVGMKSAFQNLLENWVGTENLVYLCADYPDEIEELLEVMRKKNLETVEITASSEIGGCLSWEDSSTGNISPAMYRKYIQPEITQWCRILAQAGKPYVQHACGLVRELLEPMAEQGVTGVESVTPVPTGNVTVEDIDRLLPRRVSVIGGLDPVNFLNDPLPKVLQDAERLLELSRHRGLILSNSDSCPPGVQYEKFTALAKLVREWH